MSLFWGPQEARWQKPPANAPYPTIGHAVAHVTAAHWVARVGAAAIGGHISVAAVIVTDA